MTDALVIALVSSIAPTLASIGAFVVAVRGRRRTKAQLESVTNLIESRNASLRADVLEMQRLYDNGFRRGHYVERRTPDNKRVEPSRNAD